MVSLSLTAVLLMPTVRDAEYVLVVELQPRHLGGDLVELDELAIPRLALGTEQRARSRWACRGSRRRSSGWPGLRHRRRRRSRRRGETGCALERVLTGIDDDLENPRITLFGDRPCTTPDRRCCAGC